MILNVIERQLALDMWQISGSVGARSGSGFTLTKLVSPLTGAGITEIRVVVWPATEYEEVTGLSALQPGNKVSVRGLLFHNTGTTSLVARTVRKQDR